MCFSNASPLPQISPQYWSYYVFGILFLCHLSSQSFRNYIAYLARHTKEDEIGIHWTLCFQFSTGRAGSNLYRYSLHRDQNIHRCFSKVLCRLRKISFVEHSYFTCFTCCRTVTNGLDVLQNTSVHNYKQFWLHVCFTDA
jgi:hypothetical protein